MIINNACKVFIVFYNADDLQYYYYSLSCRKKQIQTIRKRTEWHLLKKKSSYVNFPVVILYNDYARCYHWGKLGDGISLYYSLQLHLS